MLFSLLPHTPFNFSFFAAGFLQEDQGPAESMSCLTESVADTRAEVKLKLAIEHMKRTPPPLVPPQSMSNR